MRLQTAICCLLMLASCKPATAGGFPSGAGYSYLLSPSGRMFRIVQVGPVIGGAGKKIATMISYAGDTREVVRIVADAEKIIGALGPEMEFAGESSVIVQAVVGNDPSKLLSSSVSFNVVYDLRDGNWVRSPPKKEEPKEIGGPDMVTQPPDHPSFPYEPAKVAAAEEAAVKWVALLDAGDSAAAVAGMTEAFRGQLKNSMDRWSALMGQRGAAASSKRVQLYGMQVRGGPQLPAGSAVLVQFELKHAKGGHSLEQVMMVNEGASWRPAGYGFRPTPPK